MKHLFEFPLPLTLGTGSRAKPGLDPYIEYMLNEVLIKLSVRNGLRLSPLNPDYFLHLPVIFPTLETLSLKIEVTKIRLKNTKFQK